MVTSAFVTRSNELKNTLKNDVKIEYNGKSIEVVALWDTGATKSCISMDVVKNLELISLGKIQVMTPSGESTRDVYMINVKLPNDVNINDLQVCDSEIGLQKIGMLIGMDIITQGDFAVTNYNGKTRFTFRTPSKEIIDFVTDIRVNNLIGKSKKMVVVKKRKKH